MAADVFRAIRRGLRAGQRASRRANRSYGRQVARTYSRAPTRVVRTRKQAVKTQQRQVHRAVRQGRRAAKTTKKAVRPVVKARKRAEREERQFAGELATKKAALRHFFGPEPFTKQIAKADRKVYKAALEVKPEKAKLHALEGLYARQVKRKTERELEDAGDDVRKRYGLEPKKKDLKVAGLNIDEISGKGWRGAKTGGIALLEEASRTSHGIAGGTLAALEGKSVPKAISRGYRLKERKGFSDVLKKLGAPKGVAAVGGFGLDVVTDPTTFVTLGGASVARKSGELAAAKTITRRAAERAAGKLKPVTLKSSNVGQKAGRKAYQKALKRGQTPAQAAKTGAQARAAADVARQSRRADVLDTRAARRSARKAEKAAPEGRGVQMKFPGLAPTTGAATARLVRPLTKRPAGRVRTAAREVGTTFSPHVKPTGVGQKEFDELKRAASVARAAVSQGREKAMARGAAYKGAIPEEHFPAVVDAIERGTVYTLKSSKNPELRKLYEPARALELDFKAARRAEVKAGIPTAHVSGSRYFSHMREDLLEDAAKGAKKAGGGRTVRAGYTEERVHRGTVKQIAEQGGPGFSTHIPAVVAQRLSSSATDVAKGHLNRALLKAGRVVKPGKQYEVKEGEALFRLKGSTADKVDLGPAAGKEEFAKAARGEVPKDTQYVIANERFVKRQLKGMTPAQDLEGVLKAYDKATGGFKFAATVVNPGFHARNLYGDFYNAAMGAQRVHRLAHEVGTSARVLRRAGQQEKAARQIGAKLPRGGTVTVKDELGRKVPMSIDSLLSEMKRGGIRTGFVGHELPELLRAGETKVGRLGKPGKAGDTGRTIKRALQNREDLMRGASYIAARKEGKSAAEAAARVAERHFDYGDLSPFERNVMRRLLPFYTFTSRNIPLQVRTTLQRPGRLGNVQKFREETAKAQGIDLEQWERDTLREYQKRMLPVPIRVKGNIYAVAPGGLPLTDLNEIPFPGTKNWGVKGISDEWATKFTSMLNPVFRTPAELWANYNTFFRGPIERKEAPMVAAPSYVGKWPASWRKKLGVAKILDKRSGKMVWGWNAKTDYAAKVIPGPPNTIQALLTGSESRRGQGTGGKLLGSLGGIKADRTDPHGESAKLDRLFDRLDVLDKRYASLRQQQKEAEKKKVGIELGKTKAAITKLSKQRGDKLPYFTTKKKGSRTAVRRRRPGPPSLENVGGGSGPPPLSAPTGGGPPAL